MPKFGIGQPVRGWRIPASSPAAAAMSTTSTCRASVYGVVVMSPHAHARIKRIDTAKAKAAPGVLAVLTGADVDADKLGSLMPVMPEDMGGPKGYRTLRPILSSGKVRAVGDRVAFVVAETLAQARDAAELVEIDYEPLPAVTSVEDAVKPGAPAVWDDDPGNVAVALMMGDKDATDAAFAKAKHVVSVKLVNNRVSANPIEPRVDASANIIPTTTATRCIPPRRTRTAPRARRRQRAESSAEQAARDLARRRRRLRHEGRGLSRGRAGAVGVAPLRRPAGQMDVDAFGGLPRRLAWPRSGGDWRTGARRERQNSRPARERSARHGFARIRCVDGGAAVRAQAGAGRLSDSGGARRGTGGTDQYAADAALSRRRPARGDLSDRAIARPRRARDRRRSDRDPAAQLRPADGDAAQASFRHRLRQRRLYARDGRVPEARRLERLPETPGGIEEERQAARPRHRLFHRRGRDLQRPHGDPLRSERHARRSSPARIRTARAIKPSMRRWCTNGSACRSSRSASSRAIPTKSRSAAAPTGRAACMSAATR